MLVYQSVNPAVLAAVPTRARSLLDVGCGAGNFGARLKADRECRVVGITYSEQEAALARQRIDNVVVADLERYDPTPLGPFDVVVCSHVLEHLREPGRLLRALQRNLTPDGLLIVALPNVLFWKQRLQFLRGRFRYTEGGLMDRTHVHFFDWTTASQALTDAGFAITARRADGALPGSHRLGDGLAQRLDRQALQRWPGLFGHQFVYACHLADGRLPK